MDDETATLIALRTQAINDGGGKVKAVRILPDYDAGSSGPTIVFDVDYGPFLATDD